MPNVNESQVIYFLCFCLPFEISAYQRCIEKAFCSYRSTLDIMCLQVPADGALISLFRTDAKPISCPFKNGPPFLFTYNRGSGECKTPVSRADACTDDSRMLFRYQACPDVHNSESTVEELLCIGSWKDGHTRYMVGKLEHKMTSSDEERYRCFIYSKTSGKTYDLAQSADATCNGISSATDGSRTMRLTKFDSSHHHGGCKFPSWLTDHHVWHSLDHSKSYHFSAKNGTLKVTTAGSISKIDEEDEPAVSTLEMRAACNSILASSDNQIIIAAHITVGCQSGYICMAFYKRNDHVVEMQQSTKDVPNTEEACTSQNFNSQMLPYTTLITPTLHKRRCPYLGRYIVSSNNHDAWKMAASANQVIDSYPEEKPACENGKQMLSLGCNSADTMEFHSECSSDITAAYSCHGDWVDGNGTSFLIALPSSGSGRYCFVIYNIPPMASNSQTAKTSVQSKSGPVHLQVASLTESCRRNVLSEYPRPQFTFNITHHAECGGLANGVGKICSYQREQAFLLTFVLSIVTIATYSSALQPIR